MKAVVLWLVKFTGLVFLGILLVYVIWQPALPSGWIIKKMAASIDPSSLPADQTVVIQFDLSGKGGGTYNLVASRNGVEVVKGILDRADLILFMEAADFNQLMFSLATGKADEFTFRKFIIAKVLRYAGDMLVFEKVFKGQKKTP